MPMVQVHLPQKNYQDMKDASILTNQEVMNNNNNNNFDDKTQNMITIKGIIGLIMSQIDEDDEKEVISLGMGDPTAYSCFTTSNGAMEGVVDALSSAKFNGYAPTQGLPQTRKAIADYLSHDLPYNLTKEDVFVTSGCTNAIDIALSILARPGANILVPRPGFPIYQLCASFRQLEVRHFNLLPARSWEVDLDAVETLADENTVAIVVINPGNPCGNVYSFQHLLRIAEVAKKLGIIVIADEVYGHLAFGKNPFVPMGTFGSIAPVLTLGSLSKRWLVPGWRLGWLAVTDPTAIFKQPKVMERLKKIFDIYGGPPTFVQAAVPQILEKTDDAFFKKNINILKQTSELCFEGINKIPCLNCPQKPEGSMAVMVKLNLSLLKDISDDIDFCFRLAKEESVIILPGVAVGMKDWLRITFAVDPASLEEAIQRINSFCSRHAYQLD
ncbi:probable aminotransferase TAT2 [Chenopodium quinoa]|uniref:probable aminotransferase TAT2 n=1 Tax=Chenopodium quinoa TaxID=63459 RepID=UPI000B781D22|nr:probable aminotransferase TAT2 [Chenopodium quinoa]